MKGEAEKGNEKREKEKIGNTGEGLGREGSSGKVGEKGGWEKEWEY
jgi:hypothetical protein